MAHAGPELGILQQEAWLQGWIPRWTQAAVNTCKAWKHAAQNNPFILAFFLAFSPFIVIFVIVTLPLLIILICALSIALVCFLTVCFFFACGLSVYFFTVAYSLFFMMFVMWRIEPVVHRIQQLCVNTMSVPSKFYRRFKSGVCRVFTRYIRRDYGGEALR